MNLEQRKRFYRRFKIEHTAFSQSIQGIATAAGRERYASLILNRLMFLYFISQHGFLDEDTNYLQHHLRVIQEARGKDSSFSFHRSFLLRLFYEGLTLPTRSFEFTTLLGKIPHLSGDLFHVHELERNNSSIQIAGEAFARVFTFFNEYHWNLSDHPPQIENEITPDLLGYIFEKHTDQEQAGAHYTNEDICEYIATNTIIPFIFDAVEKQCPAPFEPDGPIWRVLRGDPDYYIHEAIRCEHHLPAETEREYANRRKRYAEIKAKLISGKVTSINQLITCNLDICLFVQAVIKHCEEPHLLQAFYTSLEQVTILDPNCGSGAFLLAALNILEPLYEVCLDRMCQIVPPQGDTGSHPGGRPNRRYLILKSIITNNLYGVDIMQEATEICKLRLLLKLMAQLNSVEDIKAFSAVNLNIRTGNILVGIINYDQAGRIALGEQHPSFRQDDLRVRLNSHFARTYGVDPYKPEALEQWQQSLQPFHWCLEFDKVMQNGGFDVVIGNPPYVEYSDLNYPLLLDTYKTNTCGNLYAYCIERSLALLNSHGRWSMIVPLSGFATRRMQSLQQLVMERSSSLHLSFLSGDANPSRLFEGVKFRLCIGLAKAGSDRFALYSTKYIRWYAGERNTLFSSLQYCRSDKAIIKGSLPKIGQDIELAILKKMGRQPPLHKFAGSGDKPLYYHNCPVNWMRATTFIPAFRSDREGIKISSQIRRLNFQDERLRDAATCIINSTLFFWYWLIYSDCYHLTAREIGSFPIHLDQLAYQWGDQLSSLCASLMLDYKHNSRQRTYVYRTTGTVVYDEFYPKLSKPIIDEIDCLLAQHYAFTGEELDFIINYEIKYRMGQHV